MQDEPQCIRNLSGPLIHRLSGRAPKTGLFFPSETLLLYPLHSIPLSSLSLTAFVSPGDGVSLGLTWPLLAAARAASGRASFIGHEDEGEASLCFYPQDYMLLTIPEEKVLTNGPSSQPQVPQTLESPRMPTVTMENLSCNKDDFCLRKSGLGLPRDYGRWQGHLKMFKGGVFLPDSSCFPLAPQRGILNSVFSVSEKGGSSENGETAEFQKSRP